MSRRSKVWNGFTTPPPAPARVKLPVTIGMFCPTWIFASSLSSVSSVGVESTFAVASFSSARSSAAILRICTPASVMLPRISPRLSPWPIAAGSRAIWPMFAPGELLKFWIPNPVVALVLPVPEGIACHWMPNSAALVEAISTISASTNTCARRASSLSITLRSPLYTLSGAMTTSELVSG